MALCDGCVVGGFRTVIVGIRIVGGLRMRLALGLCAFYNLYFLEFLNVTS